ncbi:MAG TPA: hypothetical protein VIL37_11875 [Natronosporangium sp.]
MLYLVVVPAAIVAIVWGLASIGGPSAKRRYRPGRPYDFIPVWYLANHRRGAAGRPGHDAEDAAAPADEEQPVQGSTGGASDRW